MADVAREGHNSGMTVQEILAKLESLANPARRAHNAKAGAPDNQFGVKLGDIRALAKKIEIDHALALALWDTGNVEAQLLAALALQPESLSAAELDELTRSTTCAQVADWLNSYVVAQHPDKEALRQKWMKAKDRWAARAGWGLTASRVNKDKARDKAKAKAKDADAGDLDLVALLDRIEKEMPKAAPEVQWTMNNTLGAIGIEHPAHRKRVLAIGEKIGLYRDWPVSKGCIPPYVPVWVDAMVKRKA
jgi:3-methyladenine DNA glycosylase AlkD